MRHARRQPVAETLAGVAVGAVTMAIVAALSTVWRGKSQPSAGASSSELRELASASLPSALSAMEVGSRLQVVQAAAPSTLGDAAAQGIEIEQTVGRAVPVPASEVALPSGTGAVPSPGQENQLSSAKQGPSAAPVPPPRSGGSPASASPASSGLARPPLARPAAPSRPDWLKTQH